MSIEINVTPQSSQSFVVVSLVRQIIFVIEMYLSTMKYCRTSMFSFKTVRLVNLGNFVIEFIGLYSDFTNVSWFVALAVQ